VTFVPYPAKRTFQHTFINLHSANHGRQANKVTAALNGN
jgi:hypothetical protein